MKEGSGQVNHINPASTPNVQSQQRSKNEGIFPGIKVLICSDTSSDIEVYLLLNRYVSW